MHRYVTKTLCICYYLYISTLCWHQGICRHNAVNHKSIDMHEKLSSFLTNWHGAQCFYTNNCMNMYIQMNILKYHCSKKRAKTLKYFWIVEPQVYNQALLWNSLVYYNIPDSTTIGKADQNLNSQRHPIPLEPFKLAWVKFNPSMNI